MISRTTVNLKKLKGKTIIIEIKGENKMEKRRVGRPRKKKKAIKKKRGRRRLPPRVKSGKNKGRFRKRN